MPLKLSRENVMRVVSVILRVPALFIAEAWCRTDPMQVHQQYHVKSSQFVMENIPPDHRHFEKELEKTHELLIHTVYYLGSIKLNCICALLYQCILTC